MAHLSLEERRIYTDIFLQLDSDGNGFLTRGELSNVALKKLGFKFDTPLSQTVLEGIFNSIDTNQDGKITLDEYLTICQTLDPNLRRLAAIRRAFQTMDLDLDGKLSEEEMFTGLQESGTPVTREDVHKVFKELDVDKDGKLSFREFIQMF